VGAATTAGKDMIDDKLDELANAIEDATTKE